MNCLTKFLQNVSLLYLISVNYSFFFSFRFNFFFVFFFIFHFHFWPEKMVLLRFCNMPIEQCGCYRLKLTKCWVKMKGIFCKSFWTLLKSTHFDGSIHWVFFLLSVKMKDKKPSFFVVLVVRKKKEKKTKKTCMTIPCSLSVQQINTQ